MTEALPSIELALLLGLRHGLVPDHLAAIDGLTMRSNSSLAPWMGALFAISHGTVMLLMVALAGITSDLLHPDQSFRGAVELLEWLPGSLLLTLAFLNARSLVHPQQARIRNPVISRILAPLNNVRPITAIGIGMLFAFGIESMLQAIAWGYAATTLGGSTTASLQVASAFVLGMVVTDALDGYATARISASSGAEAIQKFRRRIGWPIVALCLASGLQIIVSKALPNCTSVEEWLGVLGMCMVASTLTIYAVTWMKGLREART